MNFVVIYNCRLVNTDLFAPGLCLVDDVPEDDVEGHLEAALQLGVVRMTEDAFGRDFVIQFLEAFNLTRAKFKDSFIKSFTRVINANQNPFSKL